MTREQFTPLMKRMIAAYPQRPISPETVAVYWELLSDLDGDVFAEAVRRCMTSCEWFPTIKHLRHAAEDVIMESIPDPFDAMKRFPHRVMNPGIRAIVTTRLEDNDALTRPVRPQDGLGFGIVGDPRRLTDGEPDA